MHGRGLGAGAECRHVRCAPTLRRSLPAAQLLLEHLAGPRLAALQPPLVLRLRTVGARRGQAGDGWVVRLHVFRRAGRPGMCIAAHAPSPARSPTHACSRAPLATHQAQCLALASKQLLRIEAHAAHGPARPHLHLLHRHHLLRVVDRALAAGVGHGRAASTQRDHGRARQRPCQRLAEQPQLASPAASSPAAPPLQARRRRRARAAPPPAPHRNMRVSTPRRPKSKRM